MKTKFLFQYEWLNLGFTLDMPFPDMAFFAGVEIVLPVLLVLGLFTRFAALGLLGMTVVISSVLVRMIHGSWALTALILIIAGGGLASLDTGIHKALRIG